MKNGTKSLLRRTLSALLMCAMLLTLLPAVALAAGETGVTYYVALSGKGGNSGLTEADPLPGLEAVPWDALLPGDQVLLKKGDTFPGIIRLVDVHGEAGSPITIGAYGTGDAPTIDARGQGIWLQETGSTNNLGKYASAGILLYGCSYVTVSGVNVTNCPDAMKAQLETTISGKSNTPDMAYSGVAVAADDKAAAEGIVLENITVRGDSSVQTVIKETSSTVAETNLTKGAAVSPRTFTQASGTYYVSSRSGSDSNDGSTPDKAFYSLHKINELDLQPGAKVYLERGSVFENQYLHIEGGGSASAPVIIDAYGPISDPKPVINTNGNGVWYQNMGQDLDNAGHVRYGYVSSSIHLYDVEYIEVKNIAMTNGGEYGRTVNSFRYIGDDQVDGGTVPGETGYNANGNTVGAYNWGGKMSRTGVSGVAQNAGTVHHTYLQNLDIENVYGNVYIKHMNNGGIYFTVSLPVNEAQTGIAKFDDLRIEGCYVKRTSRWGITAAYTGAYHSRFNGAQIADEKCKTYGMTNLYIGHNYLDEVGGDPITAMYAFKPVIEYNVSTRGSREIGASTYHKGTAPNNNKGTVAAGIWPWKCKTALFQYNECFDMLNNEDGNGDGQPWDADYGDSTIYQYNYSSGNSGGCVMFCAGEAYNSVFRYNISYDDGSFGRPAGIIDMAGNSYGQIHNNTFVMKPNLQLHYRTSGPAQMENNIFYNLGEPFDPQWRQNERVVFNNNIYAGFSTTPDHDTKAIVMTKSETLFAGDVTTAPIAPKTTDKSGIGAVNGIRSWSRDWATDFNMFKLDSGATKAINTGVAHSFTGLNQDASFGVAQVPITEDFYGNALDNVHDIGAFDTLTADPVVENSDNELKASLYELRNTTELQVPFGANFPLTAENFKKGLTVAEGATITVLNGNDEVADDQNVAENMTVKIVAEDGTANDTVYTIKNKNNYNSQVDWVDNQQGNVWFYQGENNGVFTNQTSMGATYKDWTGAGGAVEQNQAVGNINSTAGAGFTFRAPVSGTVQVSFGYKAADDNAGKASTSGFVEGSIRKRAATPNSKWQTWLRTYRNDTENTAKAIEIPMDNITPITVASYTITVSQGDTLSFMVRNEAKTTSSTDNSGNHGVYFNPIITYKDETFTEPADEKAPTTPSGLRASNITTDGATLTWTASTDNVGVTGYEVSVNGGAAEMVTELTKTLTGLTENTEYTVTVKAVDAAGNESAEATVTFTTAKAPDRQAPTAPANGSATVIKSKSATLTWDAATDNVAVEGYEVTVNGATETVRNVTRLAVSGLTPATNYPVSVVAFDAAGNKSTALTFSFTTAAPDTQAPTVPGNARALNITTTSAALRWNPSQDNEAVVGYEVKLGENGEVKSVGNMVTYILSDLEGFTDYTAYVRALDDAGNASAWAEISFKTRGSSDCEMISSLFEIRSGAIQIPYTDQNPLTLEEFAAALEVSKDASVKVYNADGTEVISGGNVTAGMTMKVVAQDTNFESTAYMLVQKNTYNHYNDWVNKQQGNVWFAQYRNADGFHSWTPGTNNWYGGETPHYVSAERVCACDDVRPAEDRTYQGAGFTFRAPADGMVEISFGGFSSNANDTVESGARFRRDGNTSNNGNAYLVILINGEIVNVYDEAAHAFVNQKHMVNKGADRPSTTIPAFTVGVAREDNLQFMVVNEGANLSQGQVLYNPVVTYQDEAYVPRPASVELSDNEAVTLYTNAGMTNTVTRTASVLPAEAAQAVTWSSSNPQFATVNAATGEVTAVADGATVITATATATTGERVTASYNVTVVTRMESITVKNGDKTITEDEPIKLYTNTDLDANHPHSVTLTAQTTPSAVTHPMLDWVRVDGPQGRVTITDRTANNASVTITATTDILNVGEVKARVYAEEHEDVEALFTIHVIRQLANDIHITGDAKVGGTLNASTTDLTITGEGKDALTFQWAADGTDIAGATDKTYAVQPADVGKVITVTVTADPTTFYEGSRSASTEAIAKGDGPAAPELDVVNCTGGDDGQITGLDADTVYEYKLDSDPDTAWTEVTGQTVIEDLAAGTYEVRVKATDAHEAGQIATVTVLAAGVNAHKVTAAKVEGGAITVKPTQAEEGVDIAVTLTPATGYELVEDSLSVTYIDENGEEQTIPVNEGVFTMPGFDVTVTAQFQKLTFTITHALENITCTLGDDEAHEVEYGDTPVVTLTAIEGYDMPETAPEITDENGQPFYGFTYRRSTSDPTTATLTFTDGITKNLTVTAAAVEKVFAVNYRLTGGLRAPEADAPRNVSYKAAYSATISGSEDGRYTLPETISVTMGGQPFTDFEYNGENGTITIEAGKITGNLVILAAGVDTYVEPVPVTGVTISGPTTVVIGKTISLTANIAPEDATTRDVFWSSSAPEVATVNEETGEVTGVAEGTAVITVTTLDGGWTATHTVTVTKASTSRPSGSSTPSTTTTTETREDGATVTTVTKPDGSVTETVKQPDGTKTEAVTTKDGDKTITVTDASGEELAKVEIPAAIPAPETEFIDISSTPWAEEAINNVAGLKLVEGVGGNKYDPIAPMTRGALATVLHRFSNGDTNYKTTFVDIVEGKYYTDGVAWAAKAGVVTGYSDEIFAPDDTITREQLAVMMARYAKLIGLDVSAKADSLNAFVDGDKTGSWAVDGVAWCVEKGILLGKGGNTLDPNAKVTRAEVAVMLDRFIDLVK